MTKLYLVERLVVEYQLVHADSEQEAIDAAEDYNEWDRDSVSDGNELYHGVRVKYLKDLE